ncbi:hypothetical protein D3C78_1142750 [compost metagenome]
MIAAGAERTGAAGTDPLVAASVALLLLGQALLEGFEQLLQAAETVELGLVLLAEKALELLAQPVLGDQRLERRIETLQAVEVAGEGAVELVEMPLVLHQYGARQVIEGVHVGEHHLTFERLEQVEQLAQRHRHPGRAQFVEQVEQHEGALSARRAGS